MDLPRIPTRLPTRIPTAPRALAELAAFIRDRLGEVARWARPEPVDEPGADTVIVAAAAPFAPTSFARARLLRQMHACGLLTLHEAEQAHDLLGVAR